MGGNAQPRENLADMPLYAIERDAQFGRDLRVRLPVRDPREDIALTAGDLRGEVGSMVCLPLRGYELNPTPRRCSIPTRCGRCERGIYSGRLTALPLWALRVTASVNSM